MLKGCDTKFWFSVRSVFKRLHLKMWAYYPTPLSSVCAFNFVYANPPKPFWGF
jgi:hypothetical protein